MQTSIVSDLSQIDAGSVSQKRQNETKSTTPNQKRSRKVCAKYNDGIQSLLTKNFKLWVQSGTPVIFARKHFAHKPNCSRHMEKM